jgi:hypothetical protein
MIIFPHFAIAQEKLDFISENIDFSINSQHFTVNGIYSFVNYSENESYHSIIFPFSNNADSVIVKKVFNLTYNKNIVYQKINNCIAFNMIVIPKDTVNINISYSQKTQKENTYILESTQTWHKPLQTVAYSLSFDNSITIDSLSLKPDTLINNVYYWGKTNFYPNENFKIWIK